MRTITDSELRTHLSLILRQIENGETVRVTVDGRPVADLVPIQGNRWTFVPSSELRRILRDAPLDPGFAVDMDAALSETTDDL